jgi:predicted Zn-dependent protease
VNLKTTGRRAEVGQRKFSAENYMLPNPTVSVYIMRKFISNIAALGVLGLVVFFFHERISNNFLELKSRYFPCSSPVTYSIGDFDKRFGIQEEDLKQALETAEGLWEAPSHKNLFAYREEGGSVTVNLVYDSRQESTIELKKIGSTLDSGKSAYDALKSKFLSLKSAYEKDKTVFNASVSAFETRKYRYEAEVAYLNSIGGANEKQYQELQKEKAAINTAVQALNQKQAALNAQAAQINALVATLNEQAQKLNLNVKKFNEVGASNGEEFEEGVYISSPTGNKINVFQFDSEDRLRRVLAHEFGHALGIEHVENPEAIMYRLNSGKDNKLTEDDIAELNTVCKNKF